MRQPLPPMYDALLPLTARIGNGRRRDDSRPSAILNTTNTRWVDDPQMTEILLDDLGYDSCQLSHHTEPNFCFNPQAS